MTSPSVVMGLANAEIAAVVTVVNLPFASYVMTGTCVEEPLVDAVIVLVNVRTPALSTVASPDNAASADTFEPLPSQTLAEVKAVPRGERISDNLLSLPIQATLPELP